MTKCGLPTNGDRLTPNLGGTTYTLTDDSAREIPEFSGVGTPGHPARPG